MIQITVTHSRHTHRETYLVFIRKQPDTGHPVRVICRIPDIRQNNRLKIQRIKTQNFGNGQKNGQ